RITVQRAQQRIADLDVEQGYVAGVGRRDLIVNRITQPIRTCAGHRLVQADGRVLIHRGGDFILFRNIVVFRIFSVHRCDVNNFAGVHVILGDRVAAFTDQLFTRRQVSRLRRIAVQRAQQRVADLDIEQGHVAGVGGGDPVLDLIIQTVVAGADDFLDQLDIGIAIKLGAGAVAVGDIVIVGVLAGDGGGVGHAAVVHVGLGNGVGLGAASGGGARRKHVGRAADFTAQHRVVDHNVGQSHITDVLNRERVLDVSTHFIWAGAGDFLDQADAGAPVNRRGFSVAAGDIVIVRIRAGGG